MNTVTPTRPARRQQVESQPTLRQRIAAIVHNDPGVTTAEHELSRLQQQADQLRADLKTPPTAADPWQHDSIRLKLAALEPELTAARQKLSEARQQAAGSGMTLFRAERARTVAAFQEHLQGLIDSGREMMGLANLVSDLHLPVTIRDSLAGAREVQELTQRLLHILRLSKGG